MARNALPSEAERCHEISASEMHGSLAPGKRRAEGTRAELMRKRERRETVPDSCGGAGGMVERTRKKEVRNRSNGMGRRFQKVERIWTERINYCFNGFS
uniref:Uncharacterized protein n=1 Tax=Physcomitrium patens TaxID=3218 RepID=A0A2K1L2P2_PHYPA|nr:hypothetical protein PHYPA_003092 [Physcomitrium patens]